MPELYLHGLASDLSWLRHLLGNGAPLSASSLQRLKEKWQDEYTQVTIEKPVGIRLGFVVNCGMTILPDIAHE